ncbi:MAG: hypothetical protein SGPRY_008549 [Prymnesium sp.]
MPPINYNKGDNIELSDDEDNFHPNIDNNLMIRLQREKRQQREAAEEEKRKKLLEEDTEAARAELEKMERAKKLHVGNISTDRFNSKHEKSTASQSAKPSQKVDNKVKVAAVQEGKGYEEFIQSNRELMMEYAAIDEEDEKSEQFILNHTQLLSEHATGFFLLQCIGLQAEGKTQEMRKVARQALLLTYVCDLAKSMPGRDARDAIKPLFKKMELNQEVAEGFQDHLEKFISHVKTRAEVRKQEMQEEEEEESEFVTLKKGEKVGPGGLDPAEVFETLPKVMQEAFGERDIGALKNALHSMSTEDAEYHMKRCIDSGLWDPNGGAGSDEPADDAEDNVVSAEVDD